MKCSNCSYVYYCNRICQQEAWSVHKTECLFLRKIAPRTVPDAARVLSRIILKLNNGGEYEKGYYTDKCYRRFKDLMTRTYTLKLAREDVQINVALTFSDYEDLKVDEKRLEHIQSLSSVLTQLLGNELLPNPTELIQIYGKVRQ